MIVIDYKDRRPMYEQVIEKFQQMILCGAMEPETPMPSVRGLAMELSVNPNTIQRAYQELERDGYIYTVKGKGSFVSEARLKAADSKRLEIKQSLAQTIDKAIGVGISSDEIENMVKECLDESKKRG